MASEKVSGWLDDDGSLVVEETLKAKEEYRLPTDNKIIEGPQKDVVPLLRELRALRLRVQVLEALLSPNATWIGEAASEIWGEGSESMREIRERICFALQAALKEVK